MYCNFYHRQLHSPIALSSENVLSVSNASGYPVAEAMSIAVYLTTAVAQVNPQKSLERMEKWKSLVTRLEPIFDIKSYTGGSEC